MKKKYPPKYLENLFFFYPFVHFVLATTSLLDFISERSLDSFFFFVFVTYLLSPLLWRLFKFLYGQPIGVSYFGKNSEKGNNWFIAFQLQQIYNHFSFLENSLKLIPGAYSSWLRLWGSKIGKKVIWTSGAEVVDRTHLKIGSRVLLGNQSYLTAHIIKKKDKKYLLYVKDVEIGDDVVLAFQCVISPGVKIEDHAFVEAGGVLYPNEKLEKGMTHERFKELLGNRFYSLLKKHRE